MPGLSIPVDQLVVTAMLIFSRIGACLMIMPGFSSARVPMRLRLFLAIAISLCILPLIQLRLQEIAANPDLATLLVAIGSELLIGAVFGFIAQAYFWALQFMANIIAMSMGYSGQPGVSVVESMPESTLANLITLGALMIFFVTDMHLVLVRGLMISYDALPASLIIQPQAALIDAVDAISKTFLTSLHIAAPFLLYAILINFAIGLINKLTPTIPVYFISMPFVIFGGLLLLFFLLPEILRLFSGELASWLAGGP